MKTTLACAAVVAATRIVHEGEGSNVDLISAVKEAHNSLFDADVDETFYVDRERVRGAADFAGALVNFGRALKGGRND